MSQFDENTRPSYDELLQQLAAYAHASIAPSQEAWSTARDCLLDALGCAMDALAFPECRKLLGPWLPGTQVPGGARIPGTSWVLDPVQGAFNLGAMIRWLDYNDTWLAQEWGHPSDNFGSILVVADILSQKRQREGLKPLDISDVLDAAIRAYEVQGVLALNHAFNRVGLDHVLLVKIASVVACARLMQLSQDETLAALSLAWVDGQPLRTYRHAPNTGSRKSWAAGDACARAVMLCSMAQRGEMGYPSVLTAPKWGFQDVLFKGQTLRLERPLAHYVMENILFKIAYPAEFHAQTAVECALRLYPKVQGRWDDIATIHIATQESAVRIISKSGPLYNPADRDHCLQYMVAVALLHGALRAEHYEDATASDPRLDALRARMEVVEDPAMSEAYLDPERRAIPNAMQIFFKNGTSTERCQIDYPVGHRRRRKEGAPLLREKFERHVRNHFSRSQSDRIIQSCWEGDLHRLSVPQFISLWL